MTGGAVARLEDIGEISDGGLPWRPVRHHFGIRGFGVNAWTASAACERVINEADDQEELYLVHRGRATFELDGEHVDAPAGTLVVVRPGVRRTAFAEEPGTTILVLSGTPGEAYEPFESELWAPVAPLYAGGRYAEAAERTRTLVDANPDAPSLAYLLACCEVKLGHTAAALEALRAAAVSRRMRTIAAKDPDLEPLRGEPAFAEIVR